MRNFTITSWNHEAPAHFDDYDTAWNAAIKRAATEGSLVHFRDNCTTEACRIGPDGTRGSWYFDVEPSAKELLEDAIQSLE